MAAQTVQPEIQVDTGLTALDGAFATGVLVFVVLYAIVLLIWRAVRGPVRG